MTTFAGKYQHGEQRIYQLFPRDPSHTDIQQLELTTCIFNLYPEYNRLRTTFYCISMENTIKIPKISKVKQWLHSTATAMMTVLLLDG